MVDGREGELYQIASLQGNPIISIDAWTEVQGKAGGHTNPLHAVQMEEEFFIETPKKRHEGYSKDYLLENNRGKRWVIPQVIFSALFLAP